MGLLFTPAEAVPFVKATSPMIVLGRPEPQPARQSVLREVEQQPADPSSVRLGETNS